jgi:chromosome segregation ATPase
MEKMEKLSRIREAPFLTLSRRIDSQEREIDKLSRKLRELSKKDLEWVKGELLKIRGDVENFSFRFDRLMETIERERIKLEGFRTILKMDELPGKVDYLSRIVERSESSRKEIEDGMEELSNRLESMKKEMETASKKISEVEKDLGGIPLKVADLRKKIDEGSIHLKELSARSERKLKELLERMEDFRGKFDSLSEKMREVEEIDFEKLREAPLEKVEERIQSVRKELLKEVDGKIEGFDAKLKELRKELSGDILMLSSKLERKGREELEKERKEIERMEKLASKVDKQERELNQLKESIGQLAERIEEASRKKNIEELMRMKKELTSRLGQLKKEHGEGKISKDEYLGETGRIERKLSSIDAEVEELGRTKKILVEMERHARMLKELEKKIGDFASKDELNSLAMEIKSFIDEMIEEREALLRKR